MSSSAIAILVKTPGLSPIKTRLASSWHHCQAKQLTEQFYRLSVKAIEHTLQNIARPVSCYWAVAEDHGLGHDIWSEFDCIAAGHRGLGDIQHYVYQQLLKQYQQVILLGADCPQLSTELVEQAIDSLGNHSYCLGPAQDGGYYLFAGREPIKQSSWTTVAYSQPDTASQLIANLDNSPALLPSLLDVDYVADLDPMLRQMPAAPNHGQLALISWLEDLPDQSL
jgi:glycosyltransferase A (GT-A) superfamily protein (DUF2064 family)